MDRLPHCSTETSRAARAPQLQPLRTWARAATPPSAAIGAQGQRRASRTRHTGTKINAGLGVARFRFWASLAAPGNPEVLLT